MYRQLRYMGVWLTLPPNGGLKRPLDDVHQIFSAFSVKLTFLVNISRNKRNHMMAVTVRAILRLALNGHPSR